MTLFSSSPASLYIYGAQTLHEVPEAGYDDYYSYYGGSDNEYEDEKLTPNEDWSILNCAKRQRVHRVASIIELIRSNQAYNVNCNAEFKQSFEKLDPDLVQLPDHSSSPKQLVSVVSRLRLSCLTSLTINLDHGTLVSRPDDLISALPRATVRPDDPI
ncbi:hypothetical protein DY000_02041810 [Brassica cretica]|uniref:Uncharacterized protein n=1 Tax=Brassica cretica TaxID=69181 RepID=A0ABQ7B7S1_BRACR|nr:hypothetical protein DY000_02041810 [Brassica cretica]